MTLADKMAEHAVALVRTDHMGETATYYPAAGGSSTVQVVVDRLGQLQEETAGYSREVVEVFLPRDGTVGVTAVADGDDLELSFVRDEPASRGRINRVIEEDPGGWLLEVVR